MKVAFVTTGLNRGGAETQLVNLALRLRGRGYTVGIISLLPPEAFREELEACQITVASLQMKRGVPDLRAVLAFVRLLRAWKPDLVHAHQFHANLLARISRLWARMPTLICTAHSVYEAHSGCLAPRERSWREHAYRYSDLLCDLTTQICRAGLERYVKVHAVPAHKIRCVPNGIDTRSFRPSAACRVRLRTELNLGEGFQWLSVGRFDHVKDHQTLLAAFATLSVSSTGPGLLLVGDGPLRPQIVTWLSELGLKERVRMLGVRSDVAELMSAADAFVLSSFFEGLPLVLLEAHASGLPVVATAVGGVSEIVTHERTGYLCPPRDVAGLGLAMKRMTTMPLQERVQMGQTGRAHVLAHYDLDEVVSRWETIYQEFAAAKV